MAADQAKIAVIGAGPKAAALAARVAAIHDWQRRGGIVGSLSPDDLRPAPELHIFERSDRLGAHWDGRAMDGYTDGLQEVCTSLDRDLVYPHHGIFGTALNLAPFAWRTFAAARPPTIPTHRDLADYITWAVQNAQRIAPGLIHLHLSSKVVHARRIDRQWEINTNPEVSAPRFEGMVVTSPGGAIGNRFDVDSAVRARIFDAQTYWSHGQAKLRSSVVSGNQVAIIGAGGAAAAICLDILRTAVAETTAPGGVVLVAPQPTLFTRGESAFETELLTSPSWSRLPRDLRRQVSERLISGVVFARVLDGLEVIDHTPAFLVGRALAALPGSRGTAVELWCITADERICIVDADWIVDASGFDALWFLDLLDQPLQGLLRRLGASVLAEKLDEHLRLHVEAELFGDDAVELLLPVEAGLHVPFLAGGSRPPGCASLLQLGGFADQVLLPYLR